MIHTSRDADWLSVILLAWIVLFGLGLAVQAGWRRACRRLGTARAYALAACAFAAAGIYAATFHPRLIVPGLAASGWFAWCGAYHRRRPRVLDQCAAPLDSYNSDRPRSST